MLKSKLVVIGGGPGGYAAAFLAADKGIEVTLVEQNARLGGVCLLCGCIPSKALLHVAKSLSEARHLADWGVRFSAPQIDINLMRTQKERVIATLTGGLAQLAEKRGVRTIQARATFADAHTLRLEPPADAHSAKASPGDGLLQFEHCIIATGSSPIWPQPLALESSLVMDSTAALELPEVPETLLVVGGGYIGLELGTVYATLGSRVSVVEMLDGLLPGADRDLVKPLAKRVAKLFENVWIKTRVAAMRAGDDGVEVSFEGEAALSPQRFRRVLVAVGRRPNSAHLGLEKTKVTVDQRGFVVVDHQCRTAEPHIFAIGDVAGEPMLAHKATHEGKTAVEVLAGEPAAFAPRAIPAVVFTDPEIAWAGLTETAAKREDQSYQVVQFPWAASGRAQAVGRNEGLTKWLVEPASERLLGCGIVGQGAGDLIGEAALAIELGCVARDVAETIHPHPTFCETLAFAAETFYGTATDIYRPKREK